MAAEARRRGGEGARGRGGKRAWHTANRYMTVEGARERVTLLAGT